jgi:Protein of unknown function (DUF1566)
MLVRAVRGDKFNALATGVSMMRYCFAVLAAFVALPGTIASTAVAAPFVPLNDTGVFECASPTWEWSTDCAGTGQDGEFGLDATSPNRKDGLAGFRFAKVCGSGLQAGEGDCPADPPVGLGPRDWACTKDLNTGALWEMKTDDRGLHDYRNEYTHLKPDMPGYGEPGDAAGFVAAVNSDRLCGVHGWEVPNIHVLHSIMNYGSRAGGGAMVDRRFFPNMAYWIYHAEPYAQVSFQLGWATFGGYDEASLQLVRRPSKPPALRYAISADGLEVTDTLSGLVWQRCVLGHHWDGATCSGTPAMTNWYGAIELARAAGAPWRLPNVKELAASFSLKGTAKGNVTVFPGMQRGWSFWSSTPKRQQETHAWMVWNPYGSVTETYDWESAAVRLVRGP